MYYTMNEAAKRSGIPLYTLRFYAKEGLLPFVERSTGGIHRFRESDFEWLKMIECLKKTGMTLKDIRTFIHWCMEGDETIEQRLHLFEERERAVKRQIEELQEALRVIEYKKWYYETALEAGTLGVFDPDQLEEPPDPYESIWNVIDIKR